MTIGDERRATGERNLGHEHAGRLEHPSPLDLDLLRCALLVLFILILARRAAAAVFIALVLPR